MKTNRTNGNLLALVALAIINLQPSTAFAQGTAFSYQGQLQNNGSLASGIYDLRFTIYDAATNGNLIAGPLTNSATCVTNGLFTVTLNFGQGVFTGPCRWLELDVRTNGGSTFTMLQPFQPLLPMPYAIMANTASNLSGTLPAAQLSGTLPASLLAGYSGTVTLTNGGNSFNGTFSGSFSGSGAGLTGVAGTIAWQNVTGTSQQAQPNTGYLANNASQVTITLPTAPNLGDIVRVSGVGAGGWIIAQNAGQAIQAGKFGGSYTNWNSLTNWTQTTPSSGSWSVALSANGNLLLTAQPSSSSIYTSTNCGATWRQTTAPGGPAYELCLASSADGTHLAMGVGGDSWMNGAIDISTNAGATWLQSSAPLMEWSAIAFSADGTKLAAVSQLITDGEYEDPGLIYISTNSGGTWFLTSAPSMYWGSVASSADGTKLVAAVGNGGRGGIYTSTNSGATWFQTSAPSAMWESVAASADGSKLVAASAWPDYIFTSVDSGNTWMQTSAPTNAWLSWYAVASSADGDKLVAVDFNYATNEIYTSADSGTTWLKTLSWTSQYGAGAYGYAACSADGTKLAVMIDEQIYTAEAAIQTTTTPGTAGYLAGGQNSAIELQYIGNGQFMPLSYVGPISAY
jgi:hypothetical protein